MLQSECLRVANNATWWTGNRKIHKDLGVPFFCNHIKSLIKRFNLKVSWCGEPLSSAAWQISTLTKCWLSLLKRPTGDQDRHNLSRLYVKNGHIDKLNHVHLALFDYSEWGFAMPFFSVVRQMPGCNRQRWGTVRTVPRHGDFTWVPGFRCKSYLRHDHFWVRILDSLPAKVMPPHKTLLSAEQWSSVCPRWGLRPRRNIHRHKHDHTNSLRCLLSPEMW